MYTTIENLRQRGDPNKKKKEKKKKKQRGDELGRGDEYTEKDAEVERGDEIKKFQKTILQTQNLGRTVNREGTKWGLGREKSATIKETGRVPIRP